MFPTRAMALLLGIGFVDLVATAVLHSRGLITELNPLMKPIIEQSEWLFAFVKGGSLALAWYVMRNHCPDNLNFVRKACTAGAVAYVVVWTTWFTSAALGGS